MHFNHKILKVYILVMLLFSLSVFLSHYSFAEDKKSKGIVVKGISKKAAKEVAKKKSKLQQITIPSESDITTKIYKSSDKSSDVLLENVGTESSFSDDVISKDQLLRGGKIVRSKHSNSNYLTVRSGNPFLPWVLLTVLVLFQVLIFRLLGTNRV